MFRYICVFSSIYTVGYQVFSMRKDSNLLGGVSEAASALKHNAGNSGISTELRA